MLAWILAHWLALARVGISVLVAIVAMILSSVDTSSWWFWVVLALMVGLTFSFRRGLWRMFTGMWRIALILGVIFIVWVIFFRALPVAMSVVSSWWDSAKVVVAPVGQQAPEVDLSTPVLPTSQIVPMSVQSTTSSVPVTQGCPPGLVCIPAQMVATQATVVASTVVQSSSTKGGRSLDELMVGGASEEALAMSRRFSGDGK